MKCTRVLVVGGSGFIGRHLVAALAARGTRVIVPTRRRERAKHLILLPTAEVIDADVFEAGMLERLAARCDAVINVVGILHSRRGRRDERGPNDYGPDFARVHVELPQAIVRACRATGVRRLLHISALGADEDAPSEYLRSKAIGEKAVLAAEDLDVTVFRPSVVFGPEDRFLNQFASLSRFAPVIGVPCPEARFQPVYVGDVVRAMLAALEDPDARGQRYELCGPQAYRLKELVELVCRMTGRRRLVFGLPDFASYMQARFFEFMPAPLKLMTRDNYYSMQVPNVATGSAPLPFRLLPQSIEAVAPQYLVPLRSQLRPRERYPELLRRARR